MSAVSSSTWLNVGPPSSYSKLEDQPVEFKDKADKTKASTSKVEEAPLKDSLYGLYMEKPVRVDCTKKHTFENIILEAKIVLNGKKCPKCKEEISDSIQLKARKIPYEQYKAEKEKHDKKVSKAMQTLFDHVLK